jgi:23S rRNA pseudouridine1911/1915/1917 synthase
VHLASIGHPIAGDPLYGGRSKRGVPPPVLALLEDYRGLALHARELAFDHPRDGRRVELQAAKPADLEGLLAALRRLPENREPQDREPRPRGRR